jgi:Raf kinase inhibitor-like YbhB/YbcL family protein
MGDGGNLGTGGTGVDAGGDDASQGSGGAGGAHDAGSDATGSGGASGGDGSVDGGGAGGSSGSDGSVGGSSGGADGGAVRDGSADASDGKGGGAADAAADVKVPFVLTSTAFKDNQPIPAKYTCEGKTAGDGVSPPLSWTAGPSGTMSYAIVFADKANGGTKLHWIIWDIPAATTSLPEALPLQAQLSNPAGAQQWGLSNQKGYFGPCPGGNTHPYEFDLYALDVAKLGLTAGTGTSLASVVTAIKNHDLATAPLHCTSDAAAN